MCVHFWFFSNSFKILFKLGSSCRLKVLVQKKGRERERDTSHLNTVIWLIKSKRPMVNVHVHNTCSIPLRSCPVEQLKQYLSGTFSSHSSVQVRFSSVLLSSVLLSSVLLSSILEVNNCRSLSTAVAFCRHITSLQVFVWSLRDHHVKYLWDKCAAGHNSLNCWDYTNIIILPVGVDSINYK